MINIKKFSEEDIENIYRLEKETYRDFYSKQTIEKDIENKNAAYYCIYAKDVFVGYINFGFCTDFIEIYRITVAKPFQRQGYARLLLEKAESLCKDKNIGQIFLEVRESNVPARSLYEKNGFEVCGMRKDYYIDPKENAVLYNKKIIIKKDI